jgi:tetratricopeptide (TPR) repeat protein
MTKMPLLTTAFFAASLAIAAPHTVSAAGDENPPTTTKSSKCAKGKVYDEDTKKCLKIESHNFSDDELYNAARELAYAGKYDNTLIVLDAFENQQDPRVLNYRGFVNRKLGNFDKAMEFYQAALTIDPDYIRARSYMGQGLAAQGDLYGAREQLAEIRTRGGRNTWSYVALNMALRGVQTSY